MAGDNRIYDGSDTTIASDSDTHPSYLPDNIAAEALNRIFRRGIDQTRPPFTELQVVLNTGVDASVLDDWNSGNFQGAMPYQSINTATNDGIIFAMKGNIYFFTIINNIAYINLIATGNDPTMMHTWFVQAEDWIYIQNGFQDAIAWNGDLTQPATRLNPAKNEMPIGTIMAYSNGRVFVSDAKNNIYASDIIFGLGFTNTRNTRNFTETQYWAEGGSFTPATNLGLITGMRAMPTLNVNAGGQGPLVVFCTNGAFSLDTQVPRANWKDAQIQRTTLVGRGCLSPWSVTGVNNEVFFRSADGWSLYTNSELQFNQSLSFRKLSREVNKWVDQDTKYLRQFESAMFFDNRLIATVSPYTVSQQQSVPTQGLHRPHRGMIICDLDQTSLSSPDSQLNFRWNGLWTGPRPTQLLTAYIRGQQRAFCFSFDTDGKNHLFELQVEGVDDTTNTFQKKIKSYKITKRQDFSESQKTNHFQRKQLNGGDMWLSNAPEKCTVEVLYRPDSYPCWNTLMDAVSLGCDECTPQQVDCKPMASQGRYKRLVFESPNQDDCQIGSGIPANEGAEFQLRFNLEGKATIDRLRLSASPTPTADAPIPTCPEDQDPETDCSAISCCPDDFFHFYYIYD